MRRLGAVARASDAAPLRIADVGTGSGAIAVALAVGLRRRRALEAVDILATDISPDALGLAVENAVGHAVADRIRFEVADLLPPARPRSRSCWPTCRTSAATRCRPCRERRASSRSWRSTAVPTGWPSSSGCVDRLPEVLVEGGVALLEIGADQREAMLALVAERLPGWRCAIELDLAGLPRVARIERAVARGIGALVTAPPSAHGCGRASSAVPVIRTPEPILPVRLVALDIDGTLVGDDLNIGPDTRAAIRAARASGSDGLAHHRADGLERAPVRARARARHAARRLPGRAHPGDAGRRLDPAGQAADPHADVRGGRSRGRRRGHAITGWTRTSTTSSGSSCGRTIRAPTSTRRSWARRRA